MMASYKRKSIQGGYKKPAGERKRKEKVNNQWGKNGRMK